MAASKPVRRRRHPDEARAEILTAGRNLLQARPLAELTVSAVMAETTLSRKSFYVYFDDLGALLVALVQPLREATDAAMRAWADANDPITTGRAALGAAAELYRAHGALLAVVLRTPTSDPAILAAREQLTTPLRSMAADLLERSGTPEPAIAPMARALATMNVHTLLDVAPGATDDELAALADGIALIWERTINLAGADPAHLGATGST